MKERIEAQPWAMAQMAEQYGWVYRCIGYGNPTQGTYLYEYEPDPSEVFENDLEDVCTEEELFTEEELKCLIS